MEKTSLILAGRTIGEARWEALGDRVEIIAVCPFEEGYIYRAFASRGGAELCLGVMLPENGSFVAAKTLNGKQAEIFIAGKAAFSAWVTRALPGESPIAGLPFGLSAFLPYEKGTLLAPWLNEQGMCDAKALYAVFEKTIHVIFPYELGRPSPLADMFTVVTMIWHDGASYALFRIGPRGEMLM